MKRILALLLLTIASAHAQYIFNQPTSFTTGSSITVSSGVPLIGAWFWQSGSTIDFTGSTVTGLTLPVTLTGNVTGTGTGSVPTVIGTIPDLVSEPGSILFTNVASPVAPATGFIKGYANTTDKRFHDVNDAGTTGTTVVANSGVANQFVSAVSTAGVLTLSQPTGANLTNNSVTNTQLATMPANTVKANATGGVAAPTDVTNALARSSSLLDIDQKTSVGDANYTILTTDRTVVTSATLTATRTWTLPAANSVNPGQQLNLIDVFGAPNGLSNINVVRSGADTIEPGAATSLILTTSPNKQSFTLVSDGVSKWYMTAFNPGLPTAIGQIMRWNGFSAGGWTITQAIYPTAIGTLDYSMTSDGSTGYRMWPTGLTTSSSSTVSGVYSSDTYIAGSGLTIAAGDTKVLGRYHCVFDMTKTGAGTATPIITFRAGTLGTTGDAAICTLTFSAGTAVADSGTFEIWVTFRTVGAGTSAVFNAVGQCVHQGGATGLVSKNSDYAQNLSAGFNSTTQTKLGISFNGGASFSGTNTLASADLNQP